jgi:hypothetical protein
MLKVDEIYSSGYRASGCQCQSHRIVLGSIPASSDTVELRGADEAALNNDFRAQKKKKKSKKSPF